MRKYSPFFLLILALFIFLAIWCIASFEDWGSPSFGIGSAVGVAGYFLFSISLLLASRWQKLEDWIGGLDQVYHLHRHIGIVSFFLVSIHPWLYVMRWIPQHFDRFLLFTLPIHGRLSVNLGSIAYWMMIIILTVTLLKLLPYDKWKLLHKFMSAVFVLASLHILLSDKRFGSELAQSLLYIPMAIGLWGILYKQILFSIFVKRYLLEVVNVKYINDNVIELTLKSTNGPIKYKPGQYGFISFDGPLLTKESHPFTLIETLDSNTNIVLIKARGDFTKNLFEHIKSGYLASFEGPYGRFDYSLAGDSQIWIAGGIGIVPFIAWVRTIKKSTQIKLKIDFYYCVHRRIDAVFYDEFQQFSEINPNFRCFFYCSEESNRIDLTKIIYSSGGVVGKKILICGPMKLTRDIKKQLQKIGVKREDVYYEDFEFF